MTENPIIKVREKIEKIKKSKEEEISSNNADYIHSSLDKAFLMGVETVEIWLDHYFGKEAHVDTPAP